MAGALIALVDDSARVIASARSDAGGRYAVTAPQSGAVRVVLLTGDAETIASPTSRAPSSDARP